jgi:xanthine dehydrogenase accessory factor
MNRSHQARRADELAAAREPFVTAVVVRAQRPSSVSAGDCGVVRADGSIEGFVGGACAETSVRLHALRALETGEPLVLRIVPGDSDAPAEEGAVTVQNPCLSGGALEIFLQPSLPAPRVGVVGETPVAHALMALGSSVGFESGAGVTDDDAALVVASHGRDEEDSLERALLAGVPYVGLVASRRHGAAVLEELRSRGAVSEADLARIHTPAGIDIGARTSEEIALSILAEIVSTRRARVAVPDPVGEAVPAADTTPMPNRPDGFVAGLVLAAGGSSRLGRPKQTLPYRGSTLLGHVLNSARACGFDQLLVALGGGADEVREAVDLSGATVVENRAFGEGCSSSIAAALGALDPRADTLVLMLGDQPEVGPGVVERLLAGRGEAAMAVCRYEDQRGHPFAFRRELFGELANLHGDKAVWKLLDRLGPEVAEVELAGRVPLDVDTWDDYEAVVGA